MFNNFFRRAKRKILRETISKLQEIYNHEINNNHASKSDIMLNIGAGKWHCKGWTNLDYPTEWYSKAQSKHSFIPYDIRNDKIPFNDNSVKAVYSSHVIEHIEDKYIINFFADVHRVLMNDGIFRIACPDAEFLYNVSSRENNYWYWRKDWAGSKKFVKEIMNLSQIDFLVREIATPKYMNYVHAIDDKAKDFSVEFQNMSMYEFLNFITSDLTYRKDFPGDHINYWTYEKVKDMLINAGFDFVVRSKYMGSMCPDMCNPAKFDVTYPGMSLYVEAMK